MKFDLHNVLIHWQSLVFIRRDFFALYRRYDRYRELGKLIRWAKRKRLAGPHRAYTKRRQRLEIVLAHQRIVHPRISFWVPFVYELRVALFPHPSYYAKGSASRYRGHRKIV